jgi:hypothetical protein
MAIKKKVGKKLNINDVRKIRKALARTRHPAIPADLAREFGVTNRTIYDIRDRKTWATIK